MQSPGTILALDRSSQVFLLLCSYRVCEINEHGFLFNLIFLNEKVNMFNVFIMRSSLNVKGQVWSFQIICHKQGYLIVRLLAELEE